MYIRPLTFADIMETDLYYFDESRKDDPEYLSQCGEFCRQLGISYLPALRHNQTYMELVDGTFVGPMPVNDQNMVEASTRIFSSEALSQFRQSPHNVLFVVESKRVLGVVHICDYNKSQVYLYYYAHLLEFEKKLRALLILSGYTSDDMIRYYEASIKKYTPPLRIVYENKLREAKAPKREKLREALGEFQGYSITDLMFLIRYLKIMTFTKEEIDALKDLRNDVMHGQDTVEADGILFSIESLVNHFARLRLFQEKSMKVQEALDHAMNTDRRLKNNAKWEVQQQFSRPVFQRSRLMWHYLED